MGVPSLIFHFTMKKVIVFLCAGMLAYYAQAQNFVPNPDFEQVEANPCRTCDDQGDFEHMAFPWKAPVKKAAPQTRTFDHAKVSKGLPFAESPVPKSGDVMVGLHPYQYLTVELETPLKPNQRYYAEFWVALSPDAKAACNNLGMYFSSNAVNCQPFSLEQAPLQVVPQINESRIIKTPEEKWHKVSGIFSPKQPMRFLTIGNFYSPGETKMEGLGVAADISNIFYYIDNVLVLPANDEIVEAAVADLFSEGATFQLENVTFETGSERLTPGSHPELDNVADKMKLDATMKLEISGHTDNVGNEADNVRLSTARAESVKAYLVAQGIVAERITAKGYGSSRPVASNDTDEGRAKNRRVEVTIVR